MRVGVSLTIPGLSAAQTLEAAQQVAAAGAALLTFGESRHDPLALAAAATERVDVELAAGVVRWDREPASLARSAATVAELSGRPYRLGVGPGPVREPIPNSLSRLDDYLSALRAHTEDPDAVRLMLAAAGPGTAKLAGRSADSVMVSRVHSPRRLREVLLPAISDGEAGTRRIERTILVRCAVSEDDANDILAVARAVSDYELPVLAKLLADDAHDLGPALERRGAGDLDAAAAAVPEALIRGLALVGSPADCAAQLERYTDFDLVSLFPCGADATSAVEGAVRLLRYLNQ